MEGGGQGCWIMLSFTSHGDVHALRLRGEHMAPGCTTGRRQAGRGSVMLWAMFCLVTLGPAIHVDITLTCNTYLHIVALLRLCCCCTLQGWKTWHFHLTVLWHWKSKFATKRGWSWPVFFKKTWGLLDLHLIDHVSQGSKRWTECDVMSWGWSVSKYIISFHTYFSTLWLSYIIFCIKLFL